MPDLIYFLECTTSVTSTAKESSCGSVHYLCEGGIVGASNFYVACKRANVSGGFRGGASGARAPPPPRDQKQIVGIF